MKSMLIRHARRGKKSHSTFVKKKKKGKTNKKKKKSTKTRLHQTVNKC